MFPLTLAVSLLVAVIGALPHVHGAQETDDELREGVERRCAIRKLRAATRHFRCLKRARIRVLRKGLSDSQEAERGAKCERRLTQRFEWAEKAATESGFGCRSVGDAADVHQRILAAVPSLDPPCPCFQGSVAPPSPTPTSQCIDVRPDPDLGTELVTYRFDFPSLNFSGDEGSFLSRDNTSCAPANSAYFCGTITEMAPQTFCRGIHAVTAAELASCNTIIRGLADGLGIPFCLN